MFLKFGIVVVINNMMLYQTEQCWLFSWHSQRLIDSNGVYRERDLSCWSRSIFIWQNCRSTTRSKRPSCVPIEVDDDGSLLWIFQHKHRRFYVYPILKTVVDDFLSSARILTSRSSFRQECEHFQGGGSQQ